MRLPFLSLLLALPLAGQTPAKNDAQPTVARKGTEPAAMTTLRAKAVAGEAEAQFALGYACHFGQGVPQDFAEAVTWYRKAADQGHALAQSHLAYCYDEGQGVVQNVAEALKWTRKAADQGEPSAQYNLGLKVRP